jgi:F0F1-type ATP synthase membrane subunit a
MAISVLRALSLALRLLGNISLYLGTLLKQVYDLPLFVPLWIEERIAKAEARSASDRGLRGARL